VLVKKNVKGWDGLLPHAEFAFNKAPSKATDLSPFEWSMDTIEGPLWISLPFHPPNLVNLKSLCFTVILINQLNTDNFIVNRDIINHMI